MAAYPINLLSEMYEGVHLHVSSETTDVLEHVIETDLSTQDAIALFEGYRDACSLYELSLRHHCSAGEILLQRKHAKQALAQYLYLEGGTLRDNNEYPRPLLRLLYGPEIPPLKSDIISILDDCMMRALTPMQTRVIRKHYRQGLPLETIAATEGFTLSGIKSIAQAALQRLHKYRPYLEANGPEWEEDV